MVDELVRAESAVAACAAAATWALSERDLLAAIDATHRLQQRLAFVQLAARARVGRSALEAEAGRATRDRHVTVSEQPGGRLRLAGTLDAEAAGLLRAVIDPLTAPAGLDARSPGQRRHDALADVCRLALRTGELPEHGGEAAQLVVTTSYDGLTRHLRAGTLDIGLQLTPDTVRRLACDAAILPAVLGGGGQVLDVGRQRRLITGPLRRALVLRDGGCAFAGCDRPPRWCAAHHSTTGRPAVPPASTMPSCSAASTTDTSTRATGSSDSAATASRSSCHLPGSTPTSYPAATDTTDARDAADRTTRR
ncbi:DUF222 domain-containing protein [Micromonospora sp. CPCC 205539]